LNINPLTDIEIVIALKKD